MKTQKRIWALLLSALMIFSIVSLSSCDTGGETITEPYPSASTGLSFNLNDDGASYSVTGMGTCTDTDIVIPQTYEGMPITSINERAFYQCTSLMSVTIPDSVANIDYEAFDGCNALTYTVYDNGKYLGNAANPYHSLIEATDSSISSCTIHENTKVIASGAFHGCENLANVTIPNGIISIGELAFFRCTSLTNVTIPDSVTRIDRSTFYICDSLTSVTIGNGVKSIGPGAFVGCKSLTSVIIPNSVTSIEDNAFYGCTSLTSVTIPNSVTSIGRSAFSGCDALTYTVHDNGKYLGNAENPYHALIEATDSSISSCTIHKNTKVIADEAFKNCENLISITIPDSVTNIGNGAFQKCTSLINITIPNSVTSIEYNAFYGCTSLTSVTFEGTIAEWKAIKKEPKWNDRSSFTVVHCTDGDIKV